MRKMRVLIATMMLVFRLHALPRYNVDKKLVETICRNTPNYQLCISTLRANPRSINADVAGLGLIMVDAVKTRARETRNAINKLRSVRPYLRNALNDCADGYDAILKADVPEAVEALTKGDPKFAENGMADSVVEADLCEKNFIRGKSPLTRLNIAVRDLANVARAIIRNLL